jgi:hypothetical protein
LFPVILALTLFLFQAGIELSPLPFRLVAIYAAFAILVSVVASIALAFAAFQAIGSVAKFHRSILSKLTLHTLRSASNQLSITVQADGIGEREGSVVIRLAIGRDSGVNLGDRFLVANIATGKTWGSVDAVETEDASCLCSVSDRSEMTEGLEFWQGLEDRMRSDPSPPSGVSFSKYIPEGLYDAVRQILQNWEEGK